MQQGRCAAISFLRSAMVSSGLHFTRIFRPIRSLQMTWHEQHVDQTPNNNSKSMLLCTNASSMQICSKFPSYSIMLQAVPWLASIMAEECAKGPSYCPCCKGSYKLEVQASLFLFSEQLQNSCNSERCLLHIIAVSTSFGASVPEHVLPSWEQA